MYEVASSECVDIHLIKTIAQTKKMIISTGMQLKKKYMKRLRVQKIWMQKYRITKMY